MVEYEPFSVRERKARRQGQPIVFEYDFIPAAARGHAYHAIRASKEIATQGADFSEFWYSLEEWIIKEHGIFHQLPHTAQDGHIPDRRIARYLENLISPEEVLDVIEMGLILAQEWALQGVRKSSRPKKVAKLQAIVDNLNEKFRRHDLGFEYVGIPGKIVRVDSQYIQSEAVEPAISQLSIKGWDGPLDEFMEAHKHYRHGSFKSSINDALKSFESTMKSILDERGWEYDPNWQAKKLLDTLFDNGLIPPDLSSYFSGVRSTLESGVPTMRNRKAGHGQGAAVTEVPGYFAAFTLNLTATTIVFLLAANSDFAARTTS